MKSYCVSDISPRRTHNRRDCSPGYRLCYVTEQYVPRIGYLKERVRTQRYVLSTDNTKRLLMYLDVLTMTVMVILNCCSLKEKQDDRCDQSLIHDRRKMCFPLVQQGRAHTTFGISTWNLSEHDSMLA
jgi:hypothetical protein